MKAAARIPDPEPEAPTPETFLEEIQAALNAGSQRGAWEVAAQGLSLYPDHPELRRLHHALRPGEARMVSGYRVPDRREAFDWIRKNSKNYKGQWIAVLDSRLVAASPKLSEVLDIIQKSRLEAPPVLHFVTA
ncbi:MAG TPA: DUF5678 domain-containing protein [Thermoanaerobaculia bacterium]